MIDTQTWHRAWRVGRLQFGWRVYLHTYRSGDRRWVFHPFLVIDT